MHIGPYEIKRPYILAPMAGVSQMPFRRLALKLGAGLAPTELISAKGLFYESARTKTYLTFDPLIEQPFCVQLFGGEAESMAVAAQKAQEMGAQIIDINMGCPVKKVTKTNAGSALMCDQKRGADIISHMLKSTGFKIPITAKIRSGWDNNNLNYLSVAKTLEESGIAALAIHPRTRAQGYSGQANWSHIADLKAHLKIPVIGNGDVLTKHDAERMTKQTGCDAVMIGRAALGNPWIFRELIGGQAHVSESERLLLVLEHLADHISLHKHIQELEGRAPHALAAIKSFRSHLIWYSRGLTGGAQFRQEVMTSDCEIKTRDLIHEFFSSSHVTINSSDEEADGDNIDYRQAFG
jgi:nifR3 family TIM-barrel protein